MSDEFDSYDDAGVDCPNCGRLIFEGVDQCPHCREFLTDGDFKKPLPKWVVLIIVLTILSFLLPALRALF